ncbi:MAG: glycosyltransferase [Phycisphaerales bacterium]|nr:glycosyltransferase [Phycisphaerales bacterium]
MATRILVLSASVGAGHMRAAEAVEKAMRQLRPDAEVLNLDVLTLTNAIFRRVYATAYLDLVNKAPHLLGYFYDITDKPGPRDSRGDRLQRLVERLNTRRLEKLLTDQPWDMVINTHFLPASLIARARKKGKSTQKQVTVVTDFEAHAFWDNQPCEHYFVATEEAKRTLAARGIAMADMTVTGIPIDPLFAVEKDVAALRKKHKVGGDRPTVLLMAGGFGVGPIERMFDAAIEVGTPLDLIVVCGKNAKLKAKLEKVKTPERHRVQVMGFTKEMDELLAIADLIVSKPGGLTTSECLARGVPMAIVNPIPGQESRNSDFLLEHGAAIKINSLAAMTYKLDELLGDKPRMATLARNARAWGRPRAAREICERALALV